jgi:ribosome-associated toxin RatA of RatAB toxin-antitoxin module
MEGTVQTIEVAAPQQLVYEIALDIETYPDWAGGVKSVAVTEEDEHGRPTVADFTVDAMVKEISYTLDYNFEHENGFTWAARPNNDLTLLEGTYTFNVIDNDNTEVVYALRVEPNFTVPGFLRRQAEKQIVGTALRGLKKRAEEAV